MDAESQKQYQALCRGTATYILLGRNSSFGLTAEDIASQYGLDPATVREDIDKIVEAERHKACGAFETK